ncbi:MAG: hypothetical protein AAF654_06700 [Myxococcota bacterium]
MGHFLFLQNTVETPKGISSPVDGHRIAIEDQYALDVSTLSRFNGVLLSQHLDERHLAENHDAFERYLANGGAVVLNGPSARPLFQPGAYKAIPAPGGYAWRLDLADPHPITEGIEPQDLSYRRGVIGFWARGHFVLPRHAVPLTVFSHSHQPVDFVWHRPEGGRVFVHPGNDVWGWAHAETTARRFFPQLLDWLCEQ